MNLGRLERVDRIRAIWPGEETAFTPWLADEGNLDLLSQALGFGHEGLELVATEVPLPGSGYHADVLCRETGGGDEALVLVENQFGISDHSHLGKLLTYASGLKARSVVLIGESIRPEHRAALDWLNNLATEGFRFFAVEIELWRIGDSLPAPRFSVVVQPNDWARKSTEARKASEGGDLSASRQMLLDYWSEFAAVLAAHNGRVRPVKPAPQNWLVHSLGRTGATLNASWNRRENWVRAEVYLTGRTAQAYFAKLLEDRPAIEADFGGPLEWYDGAANDRRIFADRRYPDVSDRATWPDQHRWLAGRFDAMHRAFHDRVRRLRPERAGMPE
jgi:hypothetical protein